MIASVRDTSEDIIMLNGVPVTVSLTDANAAEDASIAAYVALRNVARQLDLAAVVATADALARLNAALGA